ncbi:NAD(P)-binding domain protein [Niveomyces insectorum RCEF 264]|uniref:NAD(P)-binding domain protein n=1 Tax=Niveomyces insectorum RCEF 264 TaxID=1081102 RepID=A0A167SI16_9HYPO|nr:NAD(P)-binding domain protein [Niveomyces insectorum RCEF 264]
MSAIAVPGGSGHLGRTIVEVLQDTTEHTVFVLGRKAPEEESKKASFLVVDYGDVAGTAKLLASNNIGTIVSTMSIVNKEAGDAQINLVNAAVASGTVKRFVASDWGVEHTPEAPMYPFRHASIDALKKTKLEWTYVINGYFLDYFGMPHIKSYLTPMAFAIDIANKTAGIPGTGNDVVPLTYSFDVAKFVAKLLELPRWDETTYCYGDRLTLNEILALAEKVRGTKFTVTYDPPEKLAKGEITELPAHIQTYPFFPKQALQGFLALFGRYIIAGQVALPLEKTLNAKFPDVQTAKAADIVGAWAGH